MNEPMHLLLAWCAGVALGAIFYGGLWLTIIKGMASKTPALWFFGSLLLRMSIALTGIYLVGGTHWQRLAICLLGFFMVRLASNHMVRSRGPRHAP